MKFVEPKQSAFVLLAAFLLVTAVVGTVVDRWLWPYARDWATSPLIDTAARQGRIAILIAAMLAAVVGASLGVAAWFWLIAIRIHRYGIFPPPGYPVLVKTAVLTGSVASRQAHLHVLFGVVSIGTGAYVVWSLLRIFPLSAALAALYTAAD